MIVIDIFALCVWQRKKNPEETEEEGFTFT